MSNSIVDFLRSASTVSKGPLASSSNGPLSSSSKGPLSSSSKGPLNSTSGAYHQPERASARLTIIEEGEERSTCIEEEHKEKEIEVQTYDEEEYFQTGIRPVQKNDPSNDDFKSALAENAKNLS